MTPPEAPTAPGSPGDPATQAWLEAFIRDNGGVAGTVHTRIDPETLALTASVNIPPPVVQIVGRIPKGKGMAGLAFEHNEPIATCNIKEDATGRVRPGARAVNAQAAVAFPVTDAAGSVRAVVGIAYAGDRELGQAELDVLTAAARSLP
ncbi:MAG TPA: GAF domain-containing protein [Polyangia bacterium]